MQHIDLHCHSLYSDGTMTPVELVKMARQEKLAGLALTDHDTIAGVPELLAAAAAIGLAAVSGVELSANHGDIPIHILGYGFDPAASTLNQDLARLQATRKRRNEKIIANLGEVGIEVTLAEIKTIAGQGVVGRPHFGQLLMQRGKVRSLQEAFRRYLGRGKPAYAAREKLPVAEAIRIIKRAGGVAVLAHPGVIPLDNRKTLTLINEFLAMGLDGLEVYYPGHPPMLRRQLLSLCDKENLVVTGGSDYHGDIRPATRLGAIGKEQRIPLDLLHRLQEHISSTTRLYAKNAYHSHR